MTGYNDGWSDGWTDGYADSLKRNHFPRNLLIEPPKELRKLLLKTKSKRNFLNFKYFYYKEVGRQRHSCKSNSQIRQIRKFVKNFANSSNSRNCA